MHFNALKIVKCFTFVHVFVFLFLSDHSLPFIECMKYLHHEFRFCCVCCFSLSLSLLFSNQQLVFHFYLLHVGLCLCLYVSVYVSMSSYFIVYVTRAHEICAFMEVLTVVDCLSVSVYECAMIGCCLYIQFAQTCKYHIQHSILVFVPSFRLRLYLLYAAIQFGVRVCVWERFLRVCVYVCVGRVHVFVFSFNVESKANMIHLFT